MANLPTSIKNLNTLLGEQLAEGGGGGSSDFSTAEVTFINSNNTEYNVIVPFLLDMGEFSNIQLGKYGITSDTPETVSIPLYKGKAILPVDIAFSGVERYAEPVLTGNISFALGGIIIEGDGTITFAGV